MGFKRGKPAVIYQRELLLDIQPQTSYSRDSCTGPDIETQDKAENMRRREGADQLL